MAIKREDVEKELKIGFDVCESIGEELLAFVAVKMTRNKEGHLVPTIITICEDRVSLEVQETFSEKLHELGKVMRDGLDMCGHGRSMTEYCEPCGRVNGGGE